MQCDPYCHMALWESWGGVELLTVPGWAMGTDMSTQTGRALCLRWLAVFLAVCCTWREGCWWPVRLLSFTHSLVQATLYHEFILPHKQQMTKSPRKIHLVVFVSSGSRVLQTVTGPLLSCFHFKLKLCSVSLTCSVLLTAWILLTSLL